MKKLIILTILILIGTVVTSAQIKKCFKNNGLKDGHTVYLTISGNQVSGEFIVMRDYQNEEIYNFSGTNLNNNFTINFADNKFPYQLPPKSKKGFWTLKNTAGIETLEIKIYGKNYDTNKWSIYSAKYDSCDTSYAEIVKTAQRVLFAKGATSAFVSVTLKGEADYKAFWLNLGKGQKFNVEAIGCGISFYYPDKKQYEEGTAIDTWGIEILPQSGDYLFVIKPAGVPGTCEVKFSTK